MTSIKRGRAHFRRTALTNVGFGGKADIAPASQNVTVSQSDQLATGFWASQTRPRWTYCAFARCGMRHADDINRSFAVREVTLEVINASPAFGDRNRISFGRVRTKRAASQG